MITKRIKTINIEFHLTCSACPEQYDVFKDNKQVGYVRLRWGHLRAEYPDVCGEEVYSAEIGDDACTGIHHMYGIVRQP